MCINGALLWGLIHYHVVFHAFIDGYSCLVTGIQASNNNQADTQAVLELFLDLIEVHGLPSCVWGDHGTENLRVAEYMETHRGLGRGSYIWGRFVFIVLFQIVLIYCVFFDRSVHNVQIECLWCDLSSGFGGKWKQFFQDLEQHNRLDLDLESHIWLLHYLFLDVINEDAMEWAESWNNHVIALHDARNASPWDLFFFGMLEKGIQGFDGDLEPQDEELEDPTSYGIDWDAIDDPCVLAHHSLHDWPDELGDNPFVSQHPQHFSDVTVPEVDSPLSAEQLNHLSEYLHSSPSSQSHSMDCWRLLWNSALQFCGDMFGGW